MPVAALALAWLLLALVTVAGLACLFAGSRRGERARRADALTSVAPAAVRMRLPMAG
ncbi:MAG TPA: hypothetical protein VFR07_19090 [Mycobacteriales bacterium]|nr:hypothetical protein [Mycobacteriales bacterium]